MWHRRNGTKRMVEKVRRELARYEHPLFDFSARPRDRGRGGGNPLQAFHRGRPQLHFSAASARDRERAISLDVSEATLRLPARLHHGDVHAQPAASDRASVRPAKTPLHDLLVERIRASDPIQRLRGIHGNLPLPTEFGYYSGTTDRRRADDDQGRRFAGLWPLARAAGHQTWHVAGAPGAVDHSGGGWRRGRERSLGKFWISRATLLRKLQSAAPDWAVEVSKARRVLQWLRLRSISPPAARSAAKNCQMIAEGCIFFNELLDAMVHRVVRRGARRTPAKISTLTQRVIGSSNARSPSHPRRWAITSTYKECNCRKSKRPKRGLPLAVGLKRLASGSGADSY